MKQNPYKCVHTDSKKKQYEFLEIDSGNTDDRRYTHLFCVCIMCLHSLYIVFSSNDKFFFLGVLST